MTGRSMNMIVFAAAALSLAACHQQSQKPAQEPAPQAQGEAQPAGPAMTAKPEAAPAAPAETAKPVETAPMPEASTAMTAKPAAPAPKPAAAPMTPKPKAPAPAPKPAAMAPAPKPAPSTAKAAPAPAMASFNTRKCAACHAIDHDKLGPAWKTVVEKYGDAAALAKDFESGFKERRVANAIPKWKSKEGLMTSQFNNLIKGHEKEAAHALFESVKQGKFGEY